MSPDTPTLWEILGRALLAAAMLVFLLLSFATKKISRAEPAERAASHAH